MEEPVRGIKSPWSEGVCQLGSVGWLGQCRIMILEVLLVFVGGVYCEQNEGMLVWLGRNVLRCLLRIRFSGRQWWGDWARYYLALDHSQ